MHALATFASQDGRGTDHDVDYCRWERYLSMTLAEVAARRPCR